VKIDDFKALNPQLNRPVILAAGTPQILLPWDNATVFKRNFEAHATGKYASWTAWAAPATMSVAEAARRVGMSEGDLRSVNSIPPRMLIRAGSVLIVPRTGSRQEDVASHVADNGQLNLSPEMVLRRTTVKAGKRDTVATIARRYKVSPAQVADWNNVAASAAFKAGQAVVLHLPSRASARPVTRAVAKGYAKPTLKPVAKRNVAPKKAAKRR
jgi:membrane-bound lytic murein transglycosylase D